MITGNRGDLALAAALAVVLAFAGCAPRDDESGMPPGEPDDASSFSVYTVNYPLQYFAQRIGGDRVSVVFPAPADVDPASWAPDPENIAGYQRADLILLNGAGYASWVERASLARSRLVDTSAAFRSRYIPLEDAVTHGHGPEGEHSHEGYAFTTWLDPGLAVEHARAILEAFVEARPRDAPVFHAGFASLEADLVDLDRQLDEWSRTVGETPLIFSHPVYHYFARRYGLDAVSLHWEPNETPDERQWQGLDDLIQERPVRWMIWEDRPLDATVERLRSPGIESVVLAPCANTPRDGDYLEIMQRGITALKRIGPR
jgi:zinc transport system substrate-binding protein